MGDRDKHGAEVGFDDHASEGCRDNQAVEADHNVKQAAKKDHNEHAVEGDCDIVAHAAEAEICKI